MKILNYPLTKITLSFLLGIIFAYGTKFNYNLGFALLFSSAFLLVFLYFYQKSKGKGSLFFGITTYIISFLIGTTTLITHTDSYKTTHYTHDNANFENENSIAATVKERIKSTKKNDRYVVAVVQINGIESSGNILLNLQKEQLSKQLIVGNRLFIKGKIIRNKPPYNPSSFDYSRYLENKQIYGQLYSKPQLLSVSSTVEKDVFYYCYQLTTTILHNLEKSHFDRKALSVAMALILGQKQDLSSDVLNDYQYAGAIHILSVSGLHIGFILIFLNLLLSPISNNKKGSLLKLSINITLLSLFAIIAGLSPSVIRSVVMFSFIALGYYMRRSTYIYHTIIISILIILFFQPYFLFDAGFQLSYLAVFSIIWLQPILANIWKPKYRAVQISWNILTVSFAAQIGTLPLSLFYFHQFPGLFFVTNLLILPFLSAIMTLGIVVMFFAALNCTPAFLVIPFEWSIYGMNFIINKIASFRYFVLQEIPFNTYLLISSYLIIITVILWIKKPKYTTLIGVLLAVIAFQGSYMKTIYDNQIGQELLIFNQRGNSLITERKGKIVVAYTNDTLSNSSSNLNLHSYLVSNFATLDKKHPLPNVIYFNGNKILIMDSIGVYPKDCQPDLLILTQSPKLNMDRLVATLHPKKVIADGTNYKTTVDHWKKTCKQQGISFYATSEKGFFKF